MREFCAAGVRGGGACSLDPEHKGYHSTVTYSCDGCGKRRRGYPHATAPDGAWWEDSRLQFCFLCSAPQVIGRWY
jgi:hypothetical protein